MSVETLGRGVDLYRRTALTRSAIVLLIANAIPIIGVLFFGWSLITILVLYWLENGIIGFWNVPKIALARGSIIPRLPDMSESAAHAATASPEQAAALMASWRQAQALRDQAATPGTPANALVGRLSLLPSLGLAMFFLVHYGIFWIVHGVFVFALPAFAGMQSTAAGGPGAACDPGVFPDPGEISGLPNGVGACEPGSFGEIAWGPVLIGAAALFLSHGASFLLNYLGRGEALRASPAGQMAAPYARVIVLHLTILLGGVVVAFLGAPIGALLVLVALKTLFDLGIHVREHRTAAA